MRADEGPHDERGDDDLAEFVRTQRPPSQLHPLDAAYLAFLLPNPKAYSSSYRKGQLTPFARKMLKTILTRMNSFGKLSAPAFQTAMAEMSGFPATKITEVRKMIDPTTERDGA